MALWTMTSVSVLPHSTDRTCEGSGCSPPGQRYRKTEDLHPLCPVSQGPESEPYRTNWGLGRSGPLTPGPEHWSATHIQKVKDEPLSFQYTQSYITSALPCITGRARHLLCETTQGGMNVLTTFHCIMPIKFWYSQRIRRTTGIYPLGTMTIHS